MAKNNSVEAGLLFDKLLLQGKKRKIVVFYSPGHGRFLTPEVLDRILHVANRRRWKKVFIQRDDFMGETLEMLNANQMRSNYDRGLSGIFVADPEEWEVRT